MLRIAFAVYRKWGYEIFKNIIKYQKTRQDFVLDTLISSSKHDFKVSSNINYYKVNGNDEKRIYKILKKDKIDIVYFYSWSFKVESSLLNNFICLALHPSLLPKYKGGTPIQHQLINNKKDSGITIFKMNNKVDAGDIYKQANMSLIGNVNDIFLRMIDLGTIITKDLISDYINNELVFTPQKKKKAKIFKRRTPTESEIDFKRINNMNYNEIHNLVRGLLKPYPNAFISIENYKIYIQEIEKYKEIPKNAFIINKTKGEYEKKKLKGKEIYLKLKDGYARLIKYIL